MAEVTELYLIFAFFIDLLYSFNFASNLIVGSALILLYFC